MLGIQRKKIRVRRVSSSSFKVNCLTGRYPCISIKNNGKIVLIADNGWIKLQVPKRKIQKIKQLALRDNGSLYITVKWTGRGYIIDKELKEGGMD